MISLHHLQLCQNHKVLINDLSCEFKHGEIWGIIGRNGSGKTTLLHTLAGLRQPAKGMVLIDDQNLIDLKPLDRARLLTLLLQDQEPTMACRVAEAVAMGRFAWPELGTNCQTILQQCGIEDLAERNLLTLSGGERRKVEIATCLAQPSPHWLLDEPFNHLDVVYQRHAIKLIENYAKTGSVVMVCHDLNVIQQHCTHVLMLLGQGCYQIGTSATMMSKQHLDQLFHDHNGD